jgi:hypothetical protein
MSLRKAAARGASSASWRARRSGLASGRGFLPAAPERADGEGGWLSYELPLRPPQASKRATGQLGAIVLWLE